MRLSPIRMFGLVLCLFASALILSGCFQVAGEPLQPTTGPAGGAVAQPTNVVAASPTDVIPPSPTRIPPSATVATSLGSTQAVGGAVSSATPPELAQADGAPLATLPGVAQAGVLPTTTPAGQGGGPVGQIPTTDFHAEATALVAGQGGQDVVAATAAVAEQGGQDLRPATAVAVQSTPMPSATLFPTATPEGLDDLHVAATQLIIEATQTVSAAQTATATAQGTTGPTPILTATPTPDQTDCIHVVRPGENLYRISIRYGVDQNEILTVNGLANPRLLSVGQELTIPGCGIVEARPTAVPLPTVASGETAVQPSGQTHAIQPGENLYRIALRYGVTMSALANANGIANINIIRAGDTLIIP